MIKMGLSTKGLIHFSTNIRPTKELLNRIILSRTVKDKTDRKIVTTERNILNMKIKPRKKVRGTN